jgi:alpha 1,3-glucosidase
MIWSIGELLDSSGLVNFELKNEQNSIRLAATLKAHEGGIVRLLIDEPNRQPPRFALPANDIVLEKNLSLMRLERSHQDEERTIFEIKEEGIRIELWSSPFVLRVLGDEKIKVEFNSAGLFSWESGAVAQDESFGKWLDPQPYGLQSLAADISFSGATHLMGIPGHASSVMLKSTRSLKNSTVEYDEPYRLYNLDVFEYELDSPMALYGSIPFMMGIQAGERESVAGIFWNNPTESWIDIFEKDDFAKQRVAHFMSEAGVLDLFIFTGPTIEKVLRQYYKVTGPPQLPPLFSIAYHQCRWNYVDEADLLEVNRSFDEHQIPADVIWLDIEHTDGKRYFTWNKNLFPDVERLQAEMVGRRLVLIVDPHMKRDEKYPLYAQLQAEPKLAVQNPDGGIFEGDCWPGRSVWPDYLNPLTRIWWRKQFALDVHPV